MFEAIALQIVDDYIAMQSDIGTDLTTLRADGGASGNAFLMQVQADQLQRPVDCSGVEEIGALGVAAMAFASMGIDLPLPAPQTRFIHQIEPKAVTPLSRLWAQALAKARLSD